MSQNFNRDLSTVSQSKRFTMKPQWNGVAASKATASSSNKEIDISTNTNSTSNSHYHKVESHLKNDQVAISTNEPFLKHAVSDKSHHSRFAKSIGNTSKNTISLPSTGCSFFCKLPLEARNMIYELLLVNPILGKSCSVADRTSSPRSPPPHGSSQPPLKFELEPQVLRVCHAMYLEASEILYGSNTFYIACCKYEPVEDRLPSRSAFNRGMEMTPITRHYNRSSHGQLFLFDHPAVVKVKRWRVIVSSFMDSQVLGGSHEMRFWSIENFCLAITQSPSISLEIALAPIGLEKCEESYWFQDEVSYQEMKDMLIPLRMLRGVKRLRFRDASWDELPDVYPYNTFWGKDCRSIIPSYSSRKELRSIMMGNSVVELSRRMYLRLVRYAQAFEAVDTFRSEMCHSSTGSVGRYLMHYESCSGSNRWMHRPRDPTIQSSHPVESGLRHASILSSSQYNPRAFKLERAFIVQYLEPQYQRAKLACFNITEFIKSEKRKDGMLSPKLTREWHSPTIAAEAILLLERYEQALQRDFPYADQIKHRANRRKDTSFYNNLPRNVLMRQATDAFDTMNWAFFPNCFKRMVDDLDKQFMEMRRARKELFESDKMLDVGCDIELDSKLCIEMVDWTKDEPKFGPKSNDREWNALRYSMGD
ncbi:uncharacterized protein Bfra_001567 [Botrytis fragariae]|uniref:F-box domain-containing protein n=1 Tax=Botrytis fragariae TaxID=1964551 RepID=A0A8H6EM16_9HELO|nr:uncharacterized protein Bfra_001567 [Botrytis fragariae]KAF5877203.1 hypothetical protein Bfra_001567 [Botrytis fragariae]